MLLSIAVCVAEELTPAEIGRDGTLHWPTVKDRFADVVSNWGAKLVDIQQAQKKKQRLRTAAAHVEQ